MKLMQHLRNPMNLWLTSFQIHHNEHLCVNMQELFTTRVPNISEKYSAITTKNYALKANKSFLHSIYQKNRTKKRMVISQGNE